MARDKAKDDLLFNCSQDYEHAYVAGLYGNNRQKVLDFLKSSCTRGDIYHSKHSEVYQLIKDKLGYPLPS